MQSRRLTAAKIRLDLGSATLRNRGPKSLLFQRQKKPDSGPQRCFFPTVQKGLGGHHRADRLFRIGKVAGNGGLTGDSEWPEGAAPLALT